MALSELLREITRRVPYRFGATLMNVAMRAVGKTGRGGWQTVMGPRGLPAMVLDPSLPFQRRMYFFTRAYWDRLLGLPFGRFATRELRAGDTFVDIGANIGFYTLFAAQRVGQNGRVHAFEPEPRTFESLQRSIVENGFSHATAHNLALSDREGTLPFHFVTDGSAHSLVAEAPKRADRYAGTTDVRVTTLDALGLDLARIDLIKIDVEGEEARTVRGMLETLRKAKFPPVWAEVRGPKGSTRAPDTYPAVAKTLGELAYVPYFWTEQGGLERVTSVTKREDVLFVHASRRPRCAS